MNREALDVANTAVTGVNATVGMPILVKEGKILSCISLDIYFSIFLEDMKDVSFHFITGRKIVTVLSTKMAVDT